MSEIVNDGDIVWLMIAKSGSPDFWQPNKEYKLGDTVVPRFPTTAQADYMFQAVGFVSKIGSSEPAWPTEVGAELVNGTSKLKAIDPLKNPIAILESEYYLIHSNVVAK